MVACGGGSEENTSSAPQAAVDTNLSATSEQQAPNSIEDQEIAAIVNGVAITIAELDNAVANRAVVAANAANRDALRQEVLADLIDFKLIEQYASANNIEVTESALDAEIDLLRTQAEANGGTLPALLGLPADTAPDNVAQQIYEVLLTSAVEAHVFENATLDTLQVRARHIVVNSEPEATDILVRLRNGEDFGTLAATFSQDSSTATAAGDLGWVARGELLHTEVEAIIFSLPAGTRHPIPVQSNLGWHIVEVLERDDSLALTETQQLRQRQQIFQNWLAAQRANASIDLFID